MEPNTPLNGEATRSPTSDRSPGKVNTTVNVEIFGSTYGVRSDSEPQHLEALATLVDQRMREVAGQTVAVETSRIAILAALNIADDLFRERSRDAAEESPVAKKANGLLDQLEDVLTRVD